MATVPPANLAATLIYQSNFWSAGQFTFSVAASGSTYNYDEEPDASGYGFLTPGQAARFVAAIAAWDRLINPNFTQMTEPGSVGNVRVAYTNFEDILDSWGYAFVPPVNGGAGAPWSGDIWINSKYSDGTFAAGTFDYSAMLHEIGHTLGLRHPHEAPGFNDDSYDTTTYTIMSYVDVNYLHRFFIPVNGGVQASSNDIFPSTPMVLDIAAIQQHYGASTTTAAGATTYSFSQVTPFIEAIYDAGGIDTIDLSSHTRGSNLDLTPGAYSDIAKYTVQDQIAAAVSLYGQFAAGYIADWLNRPETYTWTKNLGIAFSTTIENAKGGSGADTITGNAVANTLEGNGGADTLFGMAGDDFIIGGAGNDTIDGGVGNDVASFNIASSQATIVTGSNGAITVTSSLGVDVLIGVEILRFTNVDLPAGPPQPPPPPPPTKHGVWHDWNGDGQADMIFRDVATGEIATALTGVAGGAVTLIGTLATNWSILDVSDYDGDGKGDILFRSTTGGVQIWFSGIQGKQDQSAMIGNWTMKDSADFNGDGKADLIWHNATTGEARLWTTNPAFGFTSTSFGAFAAEWRIESAGDFRADGYADVLWRNVNSGDMLYFNLTATSLTAVGVGKLDMAFTVETCADITGDGKDDMIIRYTDGTLVLWHENGFTMAGNRSSAWTIEMADDFNADGRADIVWRHTNGQLELALTSATLGQFTVTTLGTLPPEVQVF